MSLFENNENNVYIREIDTQSYYKEFKE